MFYGEGKQLIQYPGWDLKRLMIRNAGPLEWSDFQQEMKPYRGDGDIDKDEIPPNAKYVRIIFLSYGYNRKYWITGHAFEISMPAQVKRPDGDDARSLTPKVSAKKTFWCLR
jgi:hypothetical protein